MSVASEVMEVCLLAGKIMLKYGGETYRVEETMDRMARAREMQDVHSFVTPTGIFLSFRTTAEKMERTRVIRVTDRLIDLNKVTQVNDLSRRFVSGNLSIDDAKKELQVLDQQKMIYPVYLQHIAAGLSSGAFAILFGGQLIDFLPAFLAGALANISLLFLQVYFRAKFFTEFTASLIAGLSAILFVKLGLGIHLDHVISGALMPLVPGLALTNAVRDIMAGDLVSGVGRGAEALLTALSIAAGIAIAISIF